MAEAETEKVSCGCGDLAGRTDCMLARYASGGASPG
jgi:hypothetical protein